MDVFNVHVKTTTVHKLKKQQKHPDYDNKSETRRKM